jgi:hypothetical protein
MKAISELFQSQRQRELSGFQVYVLEDGPADGNAAVRCVALDGQERVLRCCFLSVNAETSEYTLTVLTDVFGPLRATEFDESGTVGGLRCVIGLYDRVFYKVTGTPDPLVFKMDRGKTVYFGRL